MRTLPDGACAPGFRPHLPSHALVWAGFVGRLRPCTRGPVRGADPLPDALRAREAAGGHEASGVRAGRPRDGAVRPMGVRTLQDPRPFRILHRAHRDPFRKGWGGGGARKPGNPSSHWLWVQCPALQGPTQQLRGRGTDKGSREALPPKGGGWGPWTHPPHCWEVRRGEGPVHPDVSINSCSVPPRQGPQLPRASSFLILGGRAIFVSPHSYEAVHPAQRPIQGSHHEMTSCYLSGEPRIALTSLLPPSQAPPQGRQQLVMLSQRHHSRTRRQESTSLPTPVSRAVMGRRSLLSPHQGAHKHNGNRKRKWPRNCQSTGRMLSSWAGKSPYTPHPTWGLAWRP